MLTPDGLFFAPGIRFKALQVDDPSALADALAISLVGSHPTCGVGDPNSRQQRRVVIASQRLAGVSMVRWLGEPLTIGSVREHRRSTKAREVFAFVFRSYRPVQSDARHGVPVVSCLALFGRGAPASQATSVGPAEPRQRKSVLSRLCQRTAASPPRPVLMSSRTPVDGGFL